MPYTTIKKPSNYFNTKIWTGDGNTTQAITGNNYQPDLVWIKRRNGVGSNYLFNSINGANKALISDNANSEYTLSGYLNSFDNDGFTVGNDGAVNGSGDTYVAWNWLGGNGTVSNTDGDITSTVSVNTTSGFSIVTYTGTGTNATVGHGLGVAPKMYIVKRRDAGGASWCVYHASIGNTGALFLNDTAATSVSSSYWNNTSPTANVFTVGGANQAVNASSGTYIAYCFAEKQGFSKIGSYIGNGSADGTFVYTGFKPAWILIKNSGDGTMWWHIIDNKRDTDNPTDHALFSNVSDAEYNLSNYYIDYLSNGFKLRNTTTGLNASSNNYIYMAFAEEPLVGDNPATAK